MRQFGVFCVWRSFFDDINNIIRPSAQPGPGYIGKCRYNANIIEFAIAYLSDLHTHLATISAKQKGKKGKRKREGEREWEEKGGREVGSDGICRELFNGRAGAIIVVAFASIPWTPRRLIDEGCETVVAEHAAVLRALKLFPTTRYEGIIHFAGT